MEVIDIGLNDLEPISIDLDNSSSKAVNFSIALTSDSGAAYPLFIYISLKYRKFKT